MTSSYINRIATAVPPYDIHGKFSGFAGKLLSGRERPLFERMAERSQIDHRYSFLQTDHDGAELDNNGFYRIGAFPDTATRMRFYQAHVFRLVQTALDRLALAEHKPQITHIIVTSCTGFYAPGLDLQIVGHYGLDPGVERTMIGFMGCYAAFNALKLARHIVRSTLAAQILIVNVELCTLHLQATADVGQLLSYLIFADGCAASIVSAEPAGLRLDSFLSTVITDSQGLITWEIGNSGFDMVLSGQVPGEIAENIPALHMDILAGQPVGTITHWAVHPGGRSILDAVQKGFALPDEAMASSRKILRNYGNMSSATIMFVLKEILEAPSSMGAGCALAFGPGVTLESMLFYKTGS